MPGSPAGGHGRYYAVEVQIADLSLVTRGFTFVEDAEDALDRLEGAGIEDCEVVRYG